MHNRIMLHPLFVLLPVFVASASAEVTFSGSYSRTISVTAGKAVEISVGLPAPSKLPGNGRIAVEWAGYRKVIHALDADFYMVYRPVKTGPLTLKITAVQEEEPIFNLARWREPGTIQKVERFPAHTPWPTGLKVPLRVDVKPHDARPAEWPSRNCSFCGTHWP